MKRVFSNKLATVNVQILDKIILTIIIKIQICTHEVGCNYILNLIIASNVVKVELVSINNYA